MIVIWKAKYMHKYIIASSLNAHGRCRHEAFLSFVAYTSYGEQTFVVIVLMKVHNFLNLGTLPFCSNCLNFKILHLSKN